ncbi:hypothetical protein A2714_03030 [Candidatus Woesebacteria bacterium RIFCSPHIGHO2_01_FULL_38_9]|uniref:Uncharacterized protein n=2 Tax=Candidatus Woeseibacteriota TaxID=1752722 RepID=A0A1F7Y1E0_9BACT|nr:MAG: hypothetical protein A2714_03030 [Candidatus Woesebacteria bacterium RIFCSPHIGHO2_01_FULL_38_9]OGM60956.1 MAG: hypothetical protein A3A75_04290 [Candidatus Woesebacteria bacterium RIFCSPLOWO2_01_FULL_39_10]
MQDTGNTQTTVQTDINDFIERLILEKGFPAMSDEVRAQVKKDLLERLNDTVNAKIIAALDNKSIEEFSSLLDKNPSNEEIQNFIHENVPNAANFMANVLLEFRKTYLGLI